MRGIIEACIFIQAGLLTGIMQSNLVGGFNLEIGDREPELMATDQDETSDELGENPGSSLATKASRCEGYTCKMASTCGKAPLNPLAGTRSSLEPYIMEGQDQIQGEWPSFAWLEIDHNGPVSCSGVIVSDRHILTAAHCVYENETRASSVFVDLGVHKLSSSNPSRQKRYRVRSICASPRYVRIGAGAYQDYAILEVDKPIQFSNYIQPACLPYGFNKNTNYRHCHAVGAGINGFEDGQPTYPEVVQKLPVRQVSCIGVIREKLLNQTLACYKGTSGGHVSLGDSGGPILCFDTAKKRWTVIAILTQSREGIDIVTRITDQLARIKSECSI